MGGENSHETPCREVLAEVYLYLDLECAEERRGRIRRHLDECHPCLREYGIEQEVKELVARYCGAEKAPASLRDRLRRMVAELVDEQDQRRLLPENPQQQQQR